MIVLQWANLGLRFVLELCALVALGYAGFQTGQSLLAKIALAIGAPLIAAVVWGLFIAPRATMPVPLWLWLILQVVVFGSAAIGLAVAGQRSLALIFVLTVLINSALLYVSRP